MLEYEIRNNLLLQCILMCLVDNKKYDEIMKSIDNIIKEQLKEGEK